MIKYIAGILLVLFAVFAFSEEQPGITINGDVVTLTLKEFNNIVLFVNGQQEKIASLQNEVDWHRSYEVKVENCVRDHVDNHKLVLACFGDKEI